MAVNVFSFISNIFEPAAKLVDDLHTSDEERIKANNVLESLKNAIKSKMIDLQSQLLEAQKSIISAEANGHSTLQRNWRPITMLTFLVLVVLDSFGWLASPLAPEAWTLLQIGLGGYVAGRSLEKIADKVKK
jgi:hypothetical protein